MNCVHVSKDVIKRKKKQREQDKRKKEIKAHTLFLPGKCRDHCSDRHIQWRNLPLDVGLVQGKRLRC